MLARSIDGVSIGYDCIGSGPLVLLLHGFGNTRDMWAETGWTGRLKQNFTVVTMDFRGCGGSDKPTTPEGYTAEAHCRDIDSVLAATSKDSPVVWGWSLGATVALHYAKSRNVRLTVAAGTYFGPIFTDSYIDKQLAQTDDNVTRARLKGLKEWPIIYPTDIKAPFLIYTGTEDGNVYRKIQAQRLAIMEAGGLIQILEGTDHWGLISEVEKLENTVVSFIKDRIRN